MKTGVPETQRRRSRNALILLAFFILAGFSWNSVRIHLQAACLLVKLDPTQKGKLPAAAAWVLYQVTEQEHTAPLTTGVTRSRFYIPLGVKKPPGVVLVHGVHYLGIDEPRLGSFARAMASAGLLVFTPEIADLVEYRVEPASIDAIAAGASYLATFTGRAASGVIGISFAGGLALLAAADPSLQKPIGFVVAIGAHCDLNRIARYYAGEAIRDPSGRVYPTHPHPYGARVIIYAYLEKLFSPADLALAREALRLYLKDRHREARAYASRLSQAGRDKLLHILDDRDFDSIRGELLAAAGAYQNSLARVSPRGRLARLRVPVYLVHGEDDPVVPSTETLWLARETPRESLRRALVSPVLRHAEIQRKLTLRDYWELIRLLADILSQAHRL